MTLRTLNYGKYGIFLIMSNAGFISSTVLQVQAHGAVSRAKVPPQLRSFSGAAWGGGGSVQGVGCRFKVSCLGFRV